MNRDEPTPTDEHRIQSLMKRVHDASPRPTAPLAELWPDIRSRIEQQRVTPIGLRGGAWARVPRRTWWIGGVTAAAAAVIGIVASRQLQRRQ